MTYLHRFTKEGVERFRAQLDYVRQNGEVHEGFVELVMDPNFTEVMRGKIKVPDNPGEFPNRYALARFINLTFREHTSDYLYDIEMWAWISAKYFHQLCPTAKKKLKPGADARWIPEIHNYQRYYRHLAAGAFYAYNAHADEPTRAYCVLASQAGRPGDVVEQIMARQEVVASPGAMGAATLLYVNADDLTLHRGAGGKSKGAARRFIDYLAQIDVTYDIYSVDPQRILLDLPDEYERFRKHFDGFVSVVWDWVQDKDGMLLKAACRAYPAPKFFVKQALSRIELEGHISLADGSIRFGDR